MRAEAAPDLGRTEGAEGFASALVSQMMIDPGRVGLAREHGDREEGGGAVEWRPACRAAGAEIAGGEVGGSGRGARGGRAVMMSCCQANTGVTRSQRIPLSAVGCCCSKRQERTEEGRTFAC